jgi:hypothetical protein
LAAHLLRQRRRSGLVFGRTETRPFDDRALAIRATKTWTAAKLTPITLHELRHSCASIFIAAGVNAKALSSYLGHASVTITYDRYGHLMPGSEDEAVKLVDDYIEGATGARTGAQGAETAPLQPLHLRRARLRPCVAEDRRRASLTFLPQRSRVAPTGAPARGRRDAEVQERPASAGERSRLCGGFWFSSLWL